MHRQNADCAKPDGRRCDADIGCDAIGAQAEHNEKLHYRHDHAGHMRRAIFGMEIGKSRRQEPVAGQGKEIAAGSIMDGQKACQHAGNEQQAHSRRQRVPAIGGGERKQKVARFACRNGLHLGRSDRADDNPDRHHVEGHDDRQRSIGGKGNGLAGRFGFLAVKRRRLKAKERDDDKGNDGADPWIEHVLSRPHLQRQRSAPLLHQHQHVEDDQNGKFRDHEIGKHLCR